MLDIVKFYFHMMLLCFNSFNSFNIIPKVKQANASYLYKEGNIIVQTLDIQRHPAEDADRLSENQK